MPPKAKEPRVTASGGAVPPAVNRIAEAQRILTSGGYGKARTGLMATFGISKAQAERDITEAYRLIAEDAEAERPYIRARELERLVRLAEAGEKLGDAAGLSVAAKCSQQIAKLTGIEAATSIVVGVSPEQEALLAALHLSPHERRLRAERLKNEPA